MNSCTSNYYCCFEKTQSDIFPYHTKPLKSPSNLGSSQLIRTFDERRFDDNKENPFIVSRNNYNFENTDVKMMVQNHRINNSVTLSHSTKSHTPNLQSLKNSQQNILLQSSLQNTKPFQEIRGYDNNIQKSLQDNTDELNNDIQQNKQIVLKSQMSRTSNNSCTSQDIKVSLNQKTKSYGSTSLDPKPMIEKQEYGKLNQPNMIQNSYKQVKSNYKKIKQQKKMNTQKTSLIRSSNNYMSNSYLSNNNQVSSIVSQKSITNLRERNPYSSISSSSSQVTFYDNFTSKTQHYKSKLKKVSNTNVHSQYLTKNLQQNNTATTAHTSSQLINAQNTKKFKKNYHRHNISTIQLKQQSSLGNFHIKNSCFLHKIKHSQSLDRDDNPFNPIIKNKTNIKIDQTYNGDNQSMIYVKKREKGTVDRSIQEYYNSNCSIISQTIDDRKRIEHTYGFNAAKENDNRLQQHQSSIYSYTNSAYQDRQQKGREPKKYESYSKSKIFFTRFDGRVLDNDQDQEVHDFDSNYLAQEDILDEENIPLRNRDSLLSHNIKSFSTNQEFTEESKDSNDSDEQVVGVQPNQENRHKFKTNYNSRNNDKMKCLVRVSSETTVKNFYSLESKLSSIREAHNSLSIKELVYKKKKVVQDKLKQNYGNKVNQIKNEMQSKIQEGNQQDIQEKQNILEISIKNIRDFEFILQQFSDNQKVKNTLSIDDLGHAMYLMKFFVAYPRNYASIKFTDGMQLQLYLKEKELLLQLWNLLKPQPIHVNQHQNNNTNSLLENKKQFKYCVFSKALSFILSLAVDQLSIDDYRQVYQNYVTQIMKEQSQQNSQTKNDKSQSITSIQDIINKSNTSEFKYIQQQQQQELSFTQSKYYLDRDDRWELRKIITKLKELKTNNLKYTQAIEIKSLGQAQLKFQQQQRMIMQQMDNSVKSVNMEQINSVESQQIREIISMKLKLTPINKWELNFLDQK